jgi:hypothetical protein
VFKGGDVNAREDETRWDDEMFGVTIGRENVDELVSPVNNNPR